jgi:hypothetical protein
MPNTTRKPHHKAKTVSPYTFKQMVSLIESVATLSNEELEGKGMVPLSWLYSLRSQAQMLAKVIAAETK